MTTESHIVIEAPTEAERRRVAQIVTDALRMEGIAVASRWPETTSPPAWSAVVQRARFVAQDQGAPLAVVTTRAPARAAIGAEHEAAARSTC